MMKNFKVAGSVDFDELFANQFKELKEEELSPVVGGVDWRSAMSIAAVACEKAGALFGAYGSYGYYSTL